MGRRDFQSTVADSLPRIIEEQVKTSLGSIRFFKKDKKTVGKLYFRGGSIYAIEVSTYTPNIVNRIATNEHISEQNREKVLKQFQGDITNLEVIKYVLTYQMFPERPLIGYLKDYFFDAFDELYSWEGVNVEWRTNDEPSPSIPTVPNANPYELIEKLKKRKEFLSKEVAPAWQVNTEEISKLPFVYAVNTNETDYIIRVILSLADGQWTIGGVAEYLGLSHFNTKSTIYTLWQQGSVDIVHPNGDIITNRKPDPVEEALISTPAVDEPVKRQILVSNTENQKIEPKQSTPEEIEKTPELMESNNFTESETIQIVDELETFPEVENSSIIPVVSENDHVLTIPVEEEIIEEEPVVETKNTIEPNPEPLTETTPMLNQESEATTVTASNPLSASASRIQAITNQLKKELEGIGQALAETKKQKETLEQNIDSLKTEYQSYIQKAETVQNELNRKEEELNKTTQEINSFEQEYLEGIKITQELL